MASDPKPGAPRPFDVKTVEHLIGLMAQHDLTEIALQEGDQRIRLRKGGTPVVVAASAAPVAHAPAASAGPAAPAAGSPPPAPAAPAKKLHEIKSEMVGTFYAKPDPKKPEFVKVGSKITPDTTVCLIEAMKIFNEIKADVAGTIAEVCVANGDPVDFGQVLFRVDTAS